MMVLWQRRTTGYEKSLEKHGASTKNKNKIKNIWLFSVPSVPQSCISQADLTPATNFTVVG